MKIRRIVSALIAVVILLSLTACNSYSKDAFVQNGWYTDGDVVITEAEVDEILTQNYKKPKNIIYIIGDGMGVNDVEFTQRYSQDKFDFGLILKKIPNVGKAMTKSGNSPATDSAAAGTALATGTKTYNGTVGKDKDLVELVNASEIAKQYGKKVGVVTNDSVIGATPSGFLAHADSRYESVVLANGGMKLRPDVWMGGGYDGFRDLLHYENKKAYDEEFLVAKDTKSLNEVLNSDPKCQKPVIGFLNDDDNRLTATNTLAYHTEAAINRLHNKDGFFLMVESAGTDGAGHSCNIRAKMYNVVILDRVVAVALKFMKENPDTLLVITSDHDTGALQLPKEDKPYKEIEENSFELFTHSAHSADDVNVYAVGAGAEYFKDKTVDNTDVAKFVISAIKGE